MVISSSSVMPGSSEGRKIRFSSFFHWEKRKFSGRRISRNTRSMGAENMAKPSACSLARLLGEISPKISTTSVSTTVEMVGPYAAYSLVKSTVPTVDAVMFTMLLPMRMVEISRS